MAYLGYKNYMTVVCTGYKNYLLLKFLTVKRGNYKCKNG